MNMRVALLVGLTALNTGLIAAFLTRPSLLPSTIRALLPQRDPATKPATQRQPVRSPGTSTAVASPAPAELWSALHSSDLSTLVQRLRAAGFPAAMVRAIVDAEVERQFSPRLKELTRTVNDTPYWTQEAGYYTGNQKLFEAVNQLFRERSRVLRDLLGKDAFALSGVDPTALQRRQYGELSPAKIDMVQRITDDYAEMTAQVRMAMQGVTLPEDREKLALLEREKRADLAAVLTPAELADYEMRTSPVTMRLRTALTILDATEAEFRAIYAAHEPLKETLYPTSSGGMVFIGADVMDKRREATNQINEQLKTAFGEARFADYQRASDNEFQQLYRLGQRDNVPYETLVRAHEARIPIAESSMTIVQDTTLQPDEKRSALKQLAQDARTKLLSTLGPGAGPAYVGNARWITYLEQGRGFSIGPDGSLSSRSVPMPAPVRTQTPPR